MFQFPSVKLLKSDEDNLMYCVFYCADLHSQEPVATEGRALSLCELVLLLLVSSVFAWQAAIQSICADMCECPRAPLFAFCVLARTTCLKVVDFNFKVG